MTSAATSGSSANTATVLSKELSFTEKSLSFTNRDITKIALIIVGLVSAVKLFVMAACYFVFGSSIIGSVIFTVGAALLLLSLLAIDARRKTFPPGALPSELYPTHTRDLPLHFAAKLWHLPEVTDFSSDYTSQILQPYTVSAPGISGDLSYDGSALLVRLLGIGRDDWRHHTIFFRDCRLIKREIPNLARHIDGLILTKRNDIIALDEQPIFVTENLSEQLLAQALASTQQLSQEEVATITVPKEQFNHLGKLTIIVNNEFNEKTGPKLFKKLVQTYTAIFSIAIQNDLRSLQLPLLGMNETTKNDFERENLCLLALLHAVQLNLLLQPELAHFRVNYLPKRIMERDPKLYARICEYLRDPQKPLPSKTFFEETPILEHVPAERTVQYYSSKSDVGVLLAKATAEFTERQKTQQKERLKEVAAKEAKGSDRHKAAPASKETVSAVSDLLSSSAITKKRIPAKVKREPTVKPVPSPTPVAHTPITTPETTPVSVPSPTPVAHTPVTTPETTPVSVPSPTPVAHTPITTPETTPVSVPSPTPVAHTPITTPETTPVSVPSPTPVAHTPVTTPETTPVSVPSPTPVAHTPITTPETTPVSVPSPTPVAHTPVTTPETTPVSVPSPTPMAHTPVTTPEATPVSVPSPTPMAHTPVTTPEATPVSVPSPTPMAHTPVTTPEATPVSELTELSLYELNNEVCSLLSFSGKSVCGRVIFSKTRKEVLDLLEKCSEKTKQAFTTLSPKDLSSDLFIKTNPTHMSREDRDHIVDDLITQSFENLLSRENVSYILEQVLENKQSLLSKRGQNLAHLLENLSLQLKRTLQLQSQSMASISASTFSLSKKKKGVAARIGKVLVKAGQKLSDKSSGTSSTSGEDEQKPSPSKDDLEWQ
ncbi:hypothetical protein [Chlamydiifrater volucris]|uniref:hypothetical protein n=1 Tax=Chlamydiifrater volucris TaxID=2681470 RepID=UPI001BCFF0A3|nr:hypothetical protein [Chlamydiifrater volucris]